MDEDDGNLAVYYNDGDSNQTGNLAVYYDDGDRYQFNQWISAINAGAQGVSGVQGSIGTPTVSGTTASRKELLRRQPVQELLVRLLMIQIISIFVSLQILGRE